MPHIIQRHSLIESLTSEPVGERLVETTSAQKAKVLSLIGRNFISNHITEVCAVKNDFLEGMYLLKKAELVCRFRDVRELLLLHVTKAAAVDSIIRDNFACKRARRGKFGLGTSFSYDLVYCHRYSNYNIGHDRAIIVTKVLIANEKQYCEGEVIPPSNFDTTVGNNKKVYVKYSDNEYLPVFVAFYDVSNLDPDNIKDAQERKVHETVLQGVNNYLQRFPGKTRRLQRHHRPRRLNSSNAPNLISTTVPQLKTQTYYNSKLRSVPPVLANDTSRIKTSLANSSFGNADLYSLNQIQTSRRVPQPLSDIRVELRNTTAKQAVPIHNSLKISHKVEVQNATAKQIIPTSASSLKIAPKACSTTEMTNQTLPPRVSLNSSQSTVVNHTSSSPRYFKSSQNVDLYNATVNRTETLLPHSSLETPNNLNIDVQNAMMNQITSKHRSLNIPQNSNEHFHEFQPMPCPAEGFYSRRRIPNEGINVPYQPNYDSIEETSCCSKCIIM